MRSKGYRTPARPYDTATAALLTKAVVVFLGVCPCLALRFSLGLVVLVLRLVSAVLSVCLFLLAASLGGCVLLLGLFRVWSSSPSSVRVRRRLMKAGRCSGLVGFAVVVRPAWSDAVAGGFCWAVSVPVVR